MRRLGRFILVICVLAAAAAPGSVRAFLPVIAVPANLDLLPRESQPFVDLRAPLPFLTDRRTGSDAGDSNLKLFLETRSLLDDPPIAAPSLSLVDSPPPPRVTPPGFPTPDQPRPASFILQVPSVANDSMDPATRDGVAKAIEVLNRPTGVKMPMPKLTPAPDEEAKRASILSAVRALQNKQPQPELPKVESPPLKLPPAPPIAKIQIDGDEEQDATGLMVSKAITVVLGQPAELPPSLPISVPVVSASAVSSSSAGCATCGRGRLGRPLQHLRDGREAGCESCGGGWRCHPGRQPCEPCETHDGPLGRLFCDMYECLCCPDPCYDPQWRQVANAALFVDGARPVTQTEVRWNSSRGGVFPDRSEYIWARADGRGKGPRPPAGVIGPGQFAFDDLVFITETAKDKLSAIVEMPYRAMDPQFYAHGSGFGDMAIGTKTLIFDCELIQISFMMKTYLPIGNAFKGVGNGHVSLEPSLLFALKLARDTYIQGQISEWIPLGGDPEYAGSVLHTHFSLNHVVHRFGPDIPLVGTMEFNTHSFQDGSYTDPIRGPFQISSNTTYASIGPGLRLMFCDKLDIGFGSAIAITGDHFSREYYRTSVRFRF